MPQGKNKTGLMILLVSALSIIFIVFSFGTPRLPSSNQSTNSDKVEVNRLFNCEGASIPVGGTLVTAGDPTGDHVYIQRPGESCVEYDAFAVIDGQTHQLNNGPPSAYLFTTLAVAPNNDVIVCMTHMDVTLQEYPVYLIDHWDTDCAGLRGGTWTAFTRLLNGEAIDSAFYMLEILVEPDPSNPSPLYTAKAVQDKAFNPMIITDDPERRPDGADGYVEVDFIINQTANRVTLVGDERDDGPLVPDMDALWEDWLNDAGTDFTQEQKDWLINNGHATEDTFSDGPCSVDTGGCEFDGGHVWPDEILAQEATVKDWVQETAGDGGTDGGTDGGQ